MIVKILLLFSLFVNSSVHCVELNVIYDEVNDSYSLQEGIGNDVNRVGWSSFVDNITNSGWSTLESIKKNISEKDIE